MWSKELLWLLFVSAHFLYPSNGCTIPNVNWNLPLMRVDIVDTQRNAVIYSAQTTGILGITGSSHTGEPALAGGPYIESSLLNNELLLTLHENFAQYEENETFLAMNFNVVFSCTGTPATRTLTFNVHIQDTNNNLPTFIPTDHIALTVFPPLPPGFLVTGCDDQIIVRDIDLTTQRIDFRIEENAYFEIFYDTHSTIPNSKNFHAIIRTKTFVRSIPEPINLIIYATDVDNTGDDAHTESAILEISGSNDFRLPDDLIFTEAYYLATYSADHQITTQQQISLRQGFDEEVTFRLLGDLNIHFALTGVGNSRSLQVESQLPADVLNGNSSVLLIILAERELVTTAVSTLIVELPPVIAIEFEELHYKGNIVDNHLNSPELKLIHGYQQGFTVEIDSDYYSTFDYIITEGNVITLTMTLHDSETLQGYNFITLQVTATSATSSATAIVTLDIIKDDMTTPVFERAYYIGTYDPTTGLELQDIALVQGFDNTVDFIKEGDHHQYFEPSIVNNQITFIPQIPPEVIQNERQLFFSVVATKPRSVRATATVLIMLPENPSSIILRFENSNYRGSIEDDSIKLDSITLIEGYEDGILFDLNGDLKDLFRINVDAAPTLTLELIGPLPETVDNLVLLELTSFGTNAITAYTTIILEILSESDAIVLAFSETYYSGTYIEATGLNIEDTIILESGYDDSVLFDIEGDHSRWFTYVNVGNTVTLAVGSSGIPSAVLANNQHLIFEIVAERLGSAQARSAIVIALPDDLSSATILRFEHSNYRGSIEDDSIKLDSITLIEGYEDGILFDLNGDLKDLFRINVDAAPTLTLELIGPLPETVDNLVLLELTSYGTNAITAYTTIILEILSESDAIVLAFSETYYSGTYIEATGLNIEDTIILESGYDDSVLFDIEGDHSRWFTYANVGNTVTLAVGSSGIPSAVLANNQHLIFEIVAERLGSAQARSAIILALPDDLSSATILRFEHSNYRGSIEDDSIKLDSITLIEGYENGILFDLNGDFKDLFQINVDAAPTLTLELIGPLPETVNNLVLLELTSYGTNAITAYTTIILEILSESDAIVLAFSETYYSGTYIEATGLNIEDTIILESGYDDSVLFDIEGDHSRWFTYANVGNTVTLAVGSSGIPSAVLANNQHLIFEIVAERLGSAQARSAIIIALPDDLSSATILRFEHSNYRGSIEDDSIKLDSITLIEGYENGILFDLNGDFKELFRINVDAAPTLTLELIGPLPETVNNLVLLELTSYGTNAITAYTTIILEILSESDAIVLAFSETYYSGTYIEATGLNIEDTIILESGYDDSVLFDIEGDHSRWFTYANVGNTVLLAVGSSGIPSAVLANNQHLIFEIVAERLGSAQARSAIIIALPDDLSSATILRFEHSNYRGSIEDDSIKLDSITLIEGYENGILFDLNGDFKDLFRINVDAAPTLTLELIGPLPETVDNLVLLELTSYGTNAITAYTTIILEILSESDAIVLAFSETYYSGTYIEATGLNIEDTIILESGYDDSVIFDIEGDHSRWFTYANVGNTVTLAVGSSGIPAAVLANNQHLIFEIVAERLGSAQARSAVVIALPDDLSSATILRFEHSNYRGSIEDDLIKLDSITLIEGYEDGILFDLNGDLKDLFRINVDAAPTLTLELIGPLPETVDNLVLLELTSYGTNAITAYTTIILEILSESDAIVLAFSETYYSGTYFEATGLNIEDTIILESGYDDSVLFDIEGDHSRWFTYVNVGNTVTLAVGSSGIPAAVLANNQHLIFEIVAERLGSAQARSAIVIALPDDLSSATILRFEHSNYRGSIEDDSIKLDSITLIEGYEDGILFDLNGDLKDLFRINVVAAPTLTLELIGPLPETVDNLVLLELTSYGTNAITAYTTIILEILSESDAIVLAFSETYYSGTYIEATGLNIEDTIILESGYDDSVTFDIEGDDSVYFTHISDGNMVTLSVVASGIPSAVLNDNLHLVFTVIAERPGATSSSAAIFIALPDGPTSDVFFENALYHGQYELGVVQHEEIRIVGYSGNDVVITGELSALFESSVEDGQVSVEMADGSIVPLDVNHIALELRGGAARTALVIQIFHIDDTLPPGVEFTPSAYVFAVDVSQTGVIGRVHATSNNGESLHYSLHIDNDNLAERLSINSDGELHLGAPALSGVYHFIIQATTSVSDVTGTASAQLTVNAITVCGEDDHVLPPLIILEEDEEVPHENLVVLDHSDDCWLSISNRWPVDQSWLTVDERGLHAQAIDREDASIAFMTLSQVQVEIILHCNDDDQTRNKRAVSTPYNHTKVYSDQEHEYGSSRWILTDAILYNSRRSFVNLIVKDINDNPPIFVNKEIEPIVVGYPVADLINVVMPRALAELKANDADVGENARIVYWSEEAPLAVATDSGTIHVRNNMAHLLEDGLLLTVHATDRSGASHGLTGSITLQVRLLDANNIAIVTVRDAFLDDEATILQDMSNTLGYDVKILRATVISHEFEEYNQLSNKYKRNIRQTEQSNKNGNSDGGASLQLYVYGIVDTIPVSANQLIEDINNNIIGTTIADTITLEDHIENTLSCPVPGRDTGLFAATIVLSVLVFLLIAFIIFWYFFKIRKVNNYEEFSDKQSLSSIKSNTDLPKQPDSFARGKLNIDEIKRSERRLQEMLNAPVEENMPKSEILPSQTSEHVPVETILDLSTERSAPIVIQSIDRLNDAGNVSEDEDEFGQAIPKKRKSVVTFNENVEKIIHVEDNIDDTESVPDFEIDRL